MKKIVLMSMAMMATSMMQAQGLQYPKAEKDGTVDEYFGVKVSDPYRWLENDTSAQTAAWVEAENKVTDAYLQNRVVELREDRCTEKASRQVVFLT